jgi:hypothetical protein
LEKLEKNLQKSSLSGRFLGPQNFEKKLSGKAQSRGERLSETAKSL